ncbi:MAG: LptF/LptG family permease [Planctomycetota bacterium]|nr:LptF/LptG family permease [Planctomycetota bacterium]
MRGILFRSSALDVLRLFAVTAAILVVIVAFGSLIKPLAHNLLGPGSALRYAAMACVPVLEYAIPFAVGFACALSTHRMVVDNEVTAMSAAGIPMVRILLPQVIVGTVCGFILFILVNSAVPEIENKMREMLGREAARVLLASLRDGESVSAGNVVIHADSAVSMDVPAGLSPTPIERLRLAGVAAFESTPDGSPLTEFVARSAVIDLYELPASIQRDAATVLKLRLEDAVIVRPSEGTAISVPVVEPSAFALGATGARPTQFLTGTQLLRARTNPGQAAAALDARKRLETELSDGLALEHAMDNLAAGGVIEVVDDRTGRIYRCRGALLEGRTLRPRTKGSQIEVEERHNGELLRTARMSSATLPRAKGEWLSDDGTLRVGVDFVSEQARATSAASGAPLRWPKRIDNLRWMTSESLPESDGALRAESERVSTKLGAAGQPIIASVNNWNQASEKVRRAADAYGMLRLHGAALVPVVALFGAVVAVLLRRTTPLMVYVVAFVPTLIAVVLAAQGKELMRNDQVLVGLVIMWSGPTAMMAIGLGGLWKAGRP